MANPAFVQQVIANTASNQTSLTSPAFTSPTTAGNSIVVVVGTANTSADVSTVVDSTGRSYIFLGRTGVSGKGVEYWFTPDIAGSASHTVTVTDSAGLIACFVAIEVTNLLRTNSPTIDGANGSGTNSIITINGILESAPVFGIMTAVIAATGSTWTAGTMFGSTGQNLAQATSATLSMGVETQVITSIFPTASQASTLTYGVSGLYVAKTTFLLGALPMFNNYQFVRVGDGMSTAEKIR